MKKAILFVAGATLALASCSKEDTSDVNVGRGIDFRASFTGTRAVETTTANLKSFYVTAFGATQFSDVEFKQNGSFFTSAVDYYWPSDNSSVSFFAYAPSKTALGGSWSIRSNSKQISNFKPKANIDQQLDFIVASATGSMADQATGVDLEFSHILSQIGIRAKNSGDLLYKVNGVKIGSVVGTGSYNAQTSRWTPSTTASAKAEYAVSLINGAEIDLTDTAVSLMGDGGNAMLIPQTLTAWDPKNEPANDSKGAYLAVSVNISNDNGDVLYPRDGGNNDFAWVAVPIDTEWQAGHKYIYTIDFSAGAGYVDPDDPDEPGVKVLGDPIKFTVTVDTWTDAGQAITM